MATTEITQAAFELAVAECADAIDSQSWSLARRKYAKAAAISAALPLSVSGGGERLDRHANLRPLKDAIDAASAASTSGRSRFTRAKALL